MPDRATGLQEFRDALIDYKSLSSWAMGGGIAVPLVDYLIRLGPPWPLDGGVPIITSVAELLTLMCAFHLWSRSTRSGLGRRLALLIVLLFIFFGAYLYINGAYTFHSPVDDSKHVKGFILRPDVAPLITADFSAEDALAGNEYQADQVWTSPSINAAMLTLLVGWLLSFISLSAIIASFVLYYRRH